MEQRVIQLLYDLIQLVGRRIRVAVVLNIADGVQNDRSLQTWDGSAGVWGLIMALEPQVEGAIFGESEVDH